jgi:uncharacterized protein YbjT (DUF2867 family)
MKTALVAGSTGLIGDQLIRFLTEDPGYDTVIALSRKPLPIQHSKLKTVITELSSLDDHKTQLIADEVYCCLGTTMRTAGSKEAFRAVDFDYPLALAKLCYANGAKSFCLVSALGANPDSFIFYNRVKGEIENAIDEIGFDRYHIFQPSLLLGDRNEKRAGEDSAKTAYKLFGFLIPKKYQAIEGIKVARAMIHFSHEKVPGKFVHQSNILQNF